MTTARFIFRVLLLAATMTLGLPLAVSQPPTVGPTICDVRIGFNGVYKLGCWSPLVVELTGGTQSHTGQVSVTVPDTDGVPTTVYSERPVSVEPGQTTLVRLLVRVGQANSPLEVQFIADGKVLRERTFYAGLERTSGMIPGGIPATNRLFLELGPTLGLRGLIQAADRENETSATKVVHVEHAKELPINWIGYEGIDTVLLTTSEPARYRPLLQNPERIAALRRWVELGGKLVVFCAAEAEELLAPGGPLEELIPGKFTKTVLLRQWQPLETYSGSERPKTGNSRLGLRVPQLIDVRGSILAHAGRRPTDMPLVVRSYLGLGELVFVGFDFDRPPLYDWKGRASFLRKILQWKSNEEQQQPSDLGLASIDSDDMIGTLRNALDKQFVGVQVVPFALVALLVLVYVFLIGPGDYFFVRRFLKRPELTWLTFPLTVVAVSAAAYGYANWMKGDQLRLNQVEVVDVDMASGLARGTVWSHFFTPQVDQYTLTLQPSFLGKAELKNSSPQVAWLGLPGHALGAMQARASQTAVFQSGFTYGAALKSMQNVPVQVWSTKTITARWSAEVETSITASLQRTRDGLLDGQLSNSTGLELDDCLLLYRRWAYHLGRVANGTTIRLDQANRPRTVKTSLTSATAGDVTVTKTADDGTVPFRQAESDLARLVKAMMFFEAINGPSYTGKLNRYQAFLDMSHLLRQENLAILLVQSTTPGSQWLNGDQPLGSDEDRQWTYYRLVFEVEIPEE